MSYEVPKFIKPKREEHDNTPVDSESPESLEAFRASRIADSLGRAVMEMLYPTEQGASELQHQ